MLHIPKYELKYFYNAFVICYNINYEKEKKDATFDIRNVICNSRCIMTFLMNSFHVSSFIY
jgi:hypothetical protein